MINARTLCDLILKVNFNSSQFQSYLFVSKYFPLPTLNNFRNVVKTFYVDCTALRAYYRYFTSLYYCYRILSYCVTIEVEFVRRHIQRWQVRKYAFAKLLFVFNNCTTRDIEGERRGILRKFDFACLVRDISSDWPSRLDYLSRFLK